MSSAAAYRETSWARGARCGGRLLRGPSSSAGTWLALLGGKIQHWSEGIVRMETILRYTGASPEEIADVQARTWPQWN